MSKVVKKIASIALPIVGSIFGGPIGGIIGGALGGLASGQGLKGALLGGATGALGAGLGNVAGIGSAATLGAGPSSVAQSMGFLPSSAGLATGTGLRSIGQGISSAVSSIASDPSRLILGIGNQLMTGQQAETAEDAARTQAEAYQQAAKQNQRALQPYTQLGESAVNQINTIQADPTGYLNTNTFYQSLAKDAEQRLLANQAAKGKVGSGGTAAALQNELTLLGTGLVNQDLARLQGQANTGQVAASNVGGTNASYTAAAGDANATGQVASQNAYTSGYQNQINTLLALQGLQRTPGYNPNVNLFV